MLIIHARQITNLFESAYFCEQFISMINVAKNPYRYRLDNEKLNFCIDVATSGISLDIYML